MSGTVEGSVVSISDSGNLVTDLSDEMLSDAPRDESVTVSCGGHETTGIFAADHKEPDFTFIALIGDSGSLELCIVGDSAKIMLGIAVGEKVAVKW